MLIWMEFDGDGLMLMEWMDVEFDVNDGWMMLMDGC